ncbi:hypothetical protein VIGAN_02111500 [Vigna angularis var. angularis]|uniref:Uncharacterized protein n=1 Tax=Vigna angularis var. angularis TaxID=157739 RepID=A0A0S3RCY0_PHAAN|nr:hypothetical protein VIGAN_02111500 [Vigna angularis var. angularis]
MAASGISSSSSLSPNALPKMPSSYRLNGRNYRHWAQFVEITLKGFNLLNHIKGNPPPKSDLNFNTWDVQDSRVITWLLSSMAINIGCNCMSFSTAREIWEGLAKSFADRYDHAECYELQCKIFNAKQGNLTVTDYYNSLKVLWAEWDRIEILKIKKNVDSITFAQSVDRDRIFKFLSGLTCEYNDVRDKILSNKKLPGLMEVFYAVRGEETERMNEVDYD